MRSKVLLANTLALFFLCANNADSASADSVTLSVFVDGGDPNTGQVIATLFHTEENYMKNASASKTVVMGDKGEVLVTFEDVVIGEYAVSVIYDEDSDGKLDKNFFGIPKEKIGFSNNAKPSGGPAPYDKARFEVTQENTRIEITLGGVK